MQTFKFLTMFDIFFSVRFLQDENKENLPKWVKTMVNSLAICSSDVDLIWKLIKYNSFTVG